MINQIQIAKKHITNIITAAYEKAVSESVLKEGKLPGIDIEKPANREHGDFSSNIAMKSARIFSMSPVAIANALIDNMDFSNSYIESASVAGPGFINFFVSQKFYGDTVLSVLGNKDNYGKTTYGEDKRVLVEFVSANPTGPMHIGNARGGALGDCLANVLSYAGYKVEREFYVNDAGNQIEKFATSLELRYLQLFDSSIEMPEECYLGEDIVNHAKSFEKIHGDSFVNCDSEKRRAALVAFALPKNIQGLQDDLAKYRIVYDNWFRESTLHNNGEVANIIELLKKTGHTYEQDQAIWFKATDFGADKDFVLVRSNGIPTYVVPDIAYHYNKLVVRGFDKAIDVLGADHHGYVPRLKAALTALGVDADKLDAVLMQMVRLVRDGEIIKASKRSGKAITLVTLLDEVPIDAARFYFNLRESNSHFDFDLDLAVEQSSQNPVYYVQYAHARICSILRAVENENSEIGESDLSLLTSDEEKTLITQIAYFPEEINECARTYDPSRITKYVIDTAALFHKFYNAHKVMCEDTLLKNARVKLCMAVKQVIATALKILAVDAPEKM